MVAIALGTVLVGFIIAIIVGVVVYYSRHRHRHTSFVRMSVDSENTRLLFN